MVLRRSSDLLKLSQLSEWITFQRLELSVIYVGRQQREGCAIQERAKPWRILWPPPAHASECSVAYLFHHELNLTRLGRMASSPRRTCRAGTVLYQTYAPLPPFLYSLHTGKFGTIRIHRAWSSYLESKGKPVFFSLAPSPNSFDRLIHLPLK